MDKNTFRNKWTDENITYLKTAYLEGLPLKTIAEKLNRSVSAVNKVLDRHNLRTHSRMERFPTLPRPTVQQIERKRKLGAQTRKNNVQRIKFLCEDSEQWVLFEQVLRWLRTQKISVIKSNADVYYELNGIPKNKQQILFAANLLREERQLPIFFVKGVTRP